MKRYKHIVKPNENGINPNPEIISLEDFLDALRYLEEREQTVFTEISDPEAKDGFLFLSFDMTARLFMQIASLIPCAVLKIRVKDGEMSLTVSDKDGGSIPEGASLKIAKTGFLAGFNIQPCERDILLTAGISLDRELAVYAMSSLALVERFKKYFKK